MYCIMCGGNMIGDGYSMVLHCENYEGDIYDMEPDANPLYCAGPRKEPE